MLPLELDIAAAYRFYKHYLLDLTQDKAAIYAEYGFRMPQIPSTDWEVFCAILVNNRAKAGYGADLEHFEVKSAILGSSFEYQYHRLHGLEKLEEDKSVDHLFVSYSMSYQNIEIRYVRSEQIALIFDGWREELIANYQQGRQRFRKNVSFGWVRTNGMALITIQNGLLQTSAP